MASRPPLDTPQIWYRHLVRLYPRAFRDRFGPEVVQLFDDIYRDLQHAPPRHRTWRLVAAGFDTIASISQEQATALYQRLTKESHMPKKTTSSSSMRRFVTRHPRLTVFLTSLAVILVIAAWAGPTLVANASGLYLREQTYNSTMRHGDQARVVSMFVGDYIGSKQGLSTKRPAGYDSPFVVSESYASLRNLAKDTYHSMQPSFDPLLCSSRLPIKATYDTDLTGPSFGFATVNVHFSYAGDPAENTAKYLLIMQPGKGSNEGWRIASVSCTTLNHSPNPPFVLAVQPDSSLSFEEVYSN